MALWIPKHADPVGLNERIGRRLFERYKLTGAQDQKPLEKTLELYHFEGPRDDGDVSLDRLGQSSVDRRVRAYLLPRAQRAATTFKPVRSFLGWAVVSGRDLQKAEKGPSLPIVPSPIGITNDDPLTENSYHAHVKRPTAPVAYGSYEMAMHLKTIFERKYFFEKADPAPLPSYCRWWQAILQLLGK